MAVLAFLIRLNDWFACCPVRMMRLPVGPTVKAVYDALL